MLEYDRIDILERSDVNKTNASKEGDVCQYWYFLDEGFEYEPHLHITDCHDLIQRAMNFNKVAIFFC